MAFVLGFAAIGLWPARAAQPLVAIHDSELTRALESVSATGLTPSGAGTTGYQWWPTNWHYFVMPESVKEALRSDGTAFTVVGDSNILAGLLLTNGLPKYPILISLASEAVSDDEITQLTNYVAAGGTLLVGSSAFTRNPDGTTRGDFALATQMGVHVVNTTLQNWANNLTFSKIVDHRLIAHIPGGVLTWQMPAAADEIPEGTSPLHAPAGGHLVWRVQAGDAQILASGDSTPYLLVKPYGKGTFIYHAAMQPLLGHGGLAPGMYAYVVFRRAIEWAFESARLPIAKLSPWPYAYDAAFMMRHDLDNYQAGIAGISGSAQFESANGAAGDYYFCTGTLRQEMANSASAVNGLRTAMTSYNAMIGSQNGGLKNPADSSLSLGDLGYWFWGPDEALDVPAGSLPNGYANGTAYASNSLSNSFQDLDGWLSGIGNRVRAWASPNFNATREGSCRIGEALGVKTTGEQKLGPFPAWVLSTSLQTPGKRYPFISLPVNDYFYSFKVTPRMESEHSPGSVHELIDLYYGLGGLINLSSSNLATRIITPNGIEPDYLTYSLDPIAHPRVWSTNSYGIYSWWLARSNAQVAVSYATNGSRCTTTFSITGAHDPQTAVEVLFPSTSCSGLQVLTNGTAASGNGFRTNGSVIKVLAGTVVTNVQISYILNPTARNDTYTALGGQAFTVPAPGVLSNDLTGVGTNLTAVLVSPPANGTLTLNSDGGFTYTPTNAFRGMATFTYLAKDSVSNSTPATVTIDVVAPGVLFYDDFARGTNADVLAPWTIGIGRWFVGGGIMQGTASGQNAYAGANDFSEAYVGSNWRDYSVQGRIRIPAGSWAAGLSGRLNPLSGAKYTANIYEENGEFLSRKLALIKFHGWRTWSSTWTPMIVVDLNNVGTNWNTLKLSFRGNQITVDYNGSTVVDMPDDGVDGLPPFLSGGIGVHMYMDTNFVANFDDLIVLPLASDDSYAALENQTLAVPAPGVLGNDMQGLVTNLTAALVTGPTHGTLSLNANGGFSYTPANNFLGTDTFTYQATAGQTNLGNATVTIAVNTTNHAPVLPAQPNLTIGVLAALLVTNTAADADLPAQTLTYQLISPPTGAAIDAKGVITWTPSLAQLGTNAFVTVVTDNGTPSLSATNSFTVTVAYSPVLALDSTALIAEGCAPANGAIDPGETVTVTFAIRNVGLVNTTNLVATLLPGNGVLSPSGPQAYGAVVAGGTAVSQPFTFTASGTCGAPLTAVLQLQDGSLNLGTVAAVMVLGASTTIFSQSFDAVTPPALPLGWTTTTSGAQSAWATASTLSDTSPNAAYSTDAGNIGINELVTPAITLPPGQALLSFRHHYAFEADPSLATNGWDGGVLEIQIGAGAFNDIIDSGGSWVSNGYNCKIDSRWQSPITNRWAWSGTNAGFATTTVILPSAAGQTIRLRWRAASDAANGGGGWWIDTVAVTARACCSGGLPVLPPQSDQAISEWTPLVVTNTATSWGSPANPPIYLLVTAPSGAAIDTNGVITWMPTQAQSPSTNTITTAAINSGAPSLSATNSFIVVVREVNVAPSLPSIADRTINAMTLLTVTNTARNTNIHSVITGYRLASAPSGASISAGGVITWTPTLSQSPSTNLFTTVVTNSNPYDLTNPRLTATNNFTVYVSGGPSLTLVSSTLLAEAFLPTNNAIDPGETVTLLFTLKNVGGANTTNLVVTLLPTNGVMTPSGSQSYGTLIAGGAAVSQPFTFTAAPGTCGGSITGVLYLADGPGNYGTAAVSLSIGQPGIILTQTFDTVTAPALPSGWTTTNTGAEPLWITRTTLSDTAPNAAYIPDPPAIGTSDLVSPAISLPNSPARLSFRHNYNLESTGVNYYDGGVLQIQVGGGGFTDILAAGGSFVTNNYNATISGAYNSPITNQAAWSGSSGGFVTTIVNLPASAMGQSIRLRWRCATDDGNGSSNTNGWYIDTIGISGTVCATSTGPALPWQADRTIDELVMLTVTNTATDAASPPAVLTYALLAAPANAMINTNTGVITWTPTQNQSPSTNVFTTVVRDNGSPSASATNSFSVVVREVNVAPFLPGIADQTVSEMTLLTVTNTAFETNIHAVLGYALVNPPAGASIDANGIITWTPSQAQSPSTNTITTVVTNTDAYDLINPHLGATNSFTVVVREVNIAPVLVGLPDKTINELTLLTVTNTAYETNIHATLAYALVNPPAGASISASGIITWTPNQNQSPGTNTITTVVTNTDAYDLVNPHLSVTNSFSVVVREVNIAPILVGLPDKTVNELTLLTVTNTAYETNIHATIAYALVNPPAGASISASGIITWTPTQNQSPSTNTITTVVTNTDAYDQVNPHLSATNSFTVVVREVNIAPVLVGLPDETINELTLLTVTNTAYETNIHATLAYALVNPPAGASISASGIITWTPNQNQSPGTNTITTIVTNTDAYDLVNPHLSATNSFTVVVREVNIAPVLVGLPDQTINELTLLTVTNTAYETNIHATLAYALVNPPAGANISANGVITWTPGQDQSPSTNTITTIVTNTDAYDLVNPHLSATNSFTVVVREVNIAPVLVGLPDQTVSELTLLTVTNTAYETNIHATLAYALVNPPAGASISANGVITWTPTQDQSPGTNTITTVVTGTDAYDLLDPHLSATNSFTVIVREVNVAPVLPYIPDQMINELTLLTVTNTASEANIHATLAYALVNPPEGASIDTNGVITWTPTQDQSPGTNTFTTVVTNTNPYDLITPHLNATNSFVVVIREVNAAPVLPIIADQMVNELTLLTVTNTAFETNIHATLGYVLIDPPSGASIDTNGIISWVPAQDQSPGTNSITTVVTSSDPYDEVTPYLNATNSFSVVVLEVNVAPVLPIIPVQAVKEFVPLTVTNTAFETNIHSSLGYALVNPPAGAAISPGGIITWTPDQDHNPGTSTLTTVATSSNPYDLINPQLSATNSFAVVFVLGAPLPPLIQSITLSAGMATLRWSGVIGQTYRLQYRDSLAETNWSDVSPDVTATAVEATVSAPFNGATQRYYRIFSVP